MGLTGYGNRNPPFEIIFSLLVVGLITFIIISAILGKTLEMREIYKGGFYDTNEFETWASYVEGTNLSAAAFLTARSMRHTYAVGRRAANANKLWCNKNERRQYGAVEAVDEHPQLFRIGLLLRHALVTFCDFLWLLQMISQTCIRS